MIWILLLILGTSLRTTKSNLIMLKNAQHTPKNLTSVLWAHAVNSKKELSQALYGNVHMIEADIVLGKLLNDSTSKDIPIMGHPPQTTSDLSLLNFLEIISEYNRNNFETMKGIKLDFKSIEVFEGSSEILKSNLPLMNYPIWLNADILSGPVNSLTKPVDAKKFLDGCREFNTAILSIGWTTLWGCNYTEGSYTKNQIKNMIHLIKDNNVIQNITFPVRAGIAALSINQLDFLYNELKESNNITFTIWSSKNDTVNIEKLRSFIFKFGVDKIYIDVPEEVSTKLNLDKYSNTNASSSTLSSSLFYIILITVVGIVINMWI